MYGKRTARKRRETYWTGKVQEQAERERERERGQREGGKAGREYKRNDSASGEVALS